MISINTGEMLFYLGAVLICFSIVMLAITVRTIKKLETILKKILEKSQIQSDDTYQILRSTNLILNTVDSMRYQREVNQ